MLLLNESHYPTVHLVKREVPWENAILQEKLVQEVHQEPFHNTAVHLAKREVPWENALLQPEIFQLVQEVHQCQQAMIIAHKDNTKISKGSVLQILNQIEHKPATAGQTRKKQNQFAKVIITTKRNVNHSNGTDQENQCAIGGQK